ncbi:MULTISPECIES: hypothetical protein [unclassified Halomonas]|uniref:hypothetical protein n=1 Tax=unclassified Halomonas TaxID=2609666 RepID=UPI0007D99999|nr:MULTISPECIES: hypothetical protein [unclassified Halomonas]MBT2786386.1 hypothetical protein [Halomonas sp. ISL-106]MBT2797408.1 hypothetical protein [Halomonas sp. ISL-104]OAL58773.1 hypothetical protein A6R74_07765 [Halomonas sp. ALS9]
MIPLYRRKMIVLPLVIIISFLVWLSYLWAIESYRPSFKQTQVLTEIADKIQIIMLQNDLDWIQIKDGKVWPESLRGKFFNTLIKDISSANKKIEQARFSYLCRDKCYFTAYFYLNLPDEFVLEPYRYFQYNPDGHLKHIVGQRYQTSSQLTEHLQFNRLGWDEEFVPSISEALKEDVGNVYFFCEPLEQEHWHFCRGEYD